MLCCRSIKIGFSWQISILVTFILFLNIKKCKDKLALFFRKIIFLKKCCFLDFPHILGNYQQPEIEFLGCGATSINRSVYPAGWLAVRLTRLKSEL